MTWQEYQDAVAELYEQMDGFGSVRRNVRIPDRVTAQPRQIDVLIEIETKGHSLKLVVDAKFHSTPIDVRDVEAILGLADAIGANKAIIVCANGWSEPAAAKASHVGCDLRLLSIEEALELVVPEKWTMCPECDHDCVVLDQDGLIQLESGRIIMWLAGQCRSCRCARIHCPDCASKGCIPLGLSTVCGCGHEWLSTADGVAIEFFKHEAQW